MRIMIAYQDGTAEFVPCGFEDSVVASAGEWHRGVILHARPKRCYFDVDYFECAINEGQEIRGAEHRPSEVGDGRGTSQKGGQSLRRTHAVPVARHQ
jgi:hypothetical protein